MKFKPVTRYLVVIFVDRHGKWHKYKHNIKDNKHYRKKIEQFAKDNGAEYVNYYDKGGTPGRNFIEQVRFVPKVKPL